MPDGTTHDEGLLEVLAQFDSLLEAAPLGIGIFDRDLRHVRVNAVLEEMNGQPADVLLGRTPAEVNGEIGRQAEVLYREVMDSGVAMRDVRLTGQVAARPGQVRHWSTTFHPVRRAGVVIGLCVIVDDVTAEQDLYDALAVAQRAHQRLAEDLQRDLLPPMVVPGAQVAAVYRPASSSSAVGGDFYDVVEVDDQRWLLVIGDVQGKGPLAASLSGALRFAIRAAAVVDPDPARVMSTVNDVLMHLDDDRTCTAVCLLVERDGVSWSVRGVAAGHPAPLVVRGGRGDGPVGIERLGPPNLLLGAVRGTGYRAGTTTLGPGESLVIYTDGVSEARVPRSTQLAEGAPPSTPIAMFGEAGVRTALTAASASPGATSDDDAASRLAAAVHAAVEAFTGGALRDDLALLVFHVPEGPAEVPPAPR
ncbi:PP2C family protein-serine/threonine phosphatase [Actinotalea sp. Marseille-Q4924]|uniref:PP2C family protein-serine/threonine phosphatase n=1 Tax=Actinotalea sp. Marseille-Q4924 TaxID=2866571 RepID=UPI001CE431EC|nr:SpoIIE family protein phosphatase [Actinotalea sp. Marseille-Q4924]